MYVYISETLYGWDVTLYGLDVVSWMASCSSLFSNIYANFLNIIVYALYCLSNFADFSFFYSSYDYNFSFLLCN
jgi:hypothetical protein